VRGIHLKIAEKLPKGNDIDRLVRAVSQRNILSLPDEKERYLGTTIRLKEWLLVCSPDVN
jgi:hypothetical protein